MTQFIPRKIEKVISEQAGYYPIIVITGPRQTGKSTLCKHLFGEYAYYNLEDISLRNTIAADPKGFIKECGKLAIIDEAQHLPDLFSYIQLAVDDDAQRRFVLTGSNNFTLMQSITQSLAGRAALFTLLPFSLPEVESYSVSTSTNQLLTNGLYPSVIASRRPPFAYYSNYYSTYIERDVRQIKTISDLSSFQLFIKLLAGRVGSELNYSSLALEVGVTSPTIKSWLSVLQTSYIIYPLRPYYANINKRLTKSPKIYFTDSGLLCFLLGISSPEQLDVHPLRGAIFENMVVGEFLKLRFNNAQLPDLFYYRENAGREVDLMVPKPCGKFDLYEVKSSATFTKMFTRNMEYLKEILPGIIERSAVIYDGDTYPPTAFNFRNLPE